MAANIGPCGPFRFEVNPKIKVGVITLQRKRPWPSCPNPETGNQWSVDMKTNIVQVLGKTPFEIVYAPNDVQVVDDPSLRQALGTLFVIYTNYLESLHCTTDPFRIE